MKRTLVLLLVAVAALLPLRPWGLAQDAAAPIVGESKSMVTVSGRCVTETGKPLAKARVRLFRRIQHGPITRIPGMGPRIENELLRDVTTSADGRFQFREPTPVAQELRKNVFLKPYYVVAATAEGHASIDAAVGREPEQTLKLVLDSQPLSVKGRLLDVEGKPLANVSILDASGIEEFREARTNEKGEFEITGYPRSETQQHPRRRRVVEVVGRPGLYRREAFYVTPGAEPVELKLKRPLSVPRVDVYGGLNAIQGDYDKDGDIDVFVLGSQPGAAEADETGPATPPGIALPAQRIPPGSSLTPASAKPAAADPAGRPGGLGPIPQVPGSISPEPAAEVRVFRLKHRDPEQIAGILAQLAPNVRIVPEAISRKLLVVGDAGELRLVEDVLKLLDVKAQSSDDDAYEDISTSMYEEMTPAPSESPKAARQRFAQLDGRSRQIAQQYREIQSSEPSDAERRKLRAQLESTIKQAFQARQQWQRAEVAQLRAKLRRIETRIADRQRVAEAIVKRRVGDLLNPALRWEPAGDDRSGTPLVSGLGPGSLSSSALAYPPAPRSPIGLSVPAVMHDAAQPPATPRIVGLVEHVEDHQVTINVGPGDGVRPRMTAAVLRSDESSRVRLIAKGTIIRSIRPDRSIVRIESSEAQIQPRAGDSVVVAADEFFLDSIIQVMSSLGLQSQPSGPAKKPSEVQSTPLDALPTY